MRALSKGLRVGAVVAAGALVLAACGSGSSNGGGTKQSVLSSSKGPISTPGDYGSLPKKHGKIRHGGTITVAQLEGSTPVYIFPITPGADLSVYTADFEDFMWRPLYWGPQGDAVPSIDPTDSLANPAKFSDHNKILKITLKDWKWSDGAPITAQDAVFDYWLFKAAVTLSPANEGDYTPGLYPDNVSSITASGRTITIHWNKTYNQDFLLYSQIGDLEPLPAQVWATTGNGKMFGANSGPNGYENLKNAEAIYTYLSGLSTPSNFKDPFWMKAVDGPFKLSNFVTADGNYTLVPNPRYSGHHPYASKIEFITYTSQTAQFDALKTNAVDVAGVDQADLADVGSIKNNYDVWGAPNFGWNYVVYNFKDKTGDFNHLISQLYIRQALAHVQNENAEIKSRGIWDGAAGAAYGPVPSTPVSPLAPPTASKNPYPYSLKTAKSLLQSHGWKIHAGGTDVCIKAGTKKDECGPGIPKGTKMQWNLIYLVPQEVAEIQVEDEAWVANARKVGIHMELSAKTFNFMISNYNDVSAPKNDNSWAMEDFGGFTGIEYPTTNEVFNTSGSFNIGGFNSPTINAAIHGSIYSLSNDAVKHEAEEVGLLMPGLFQPNPDLIYAFSKKISAPAANFENLTQYTETPEYWYLIK